MHGNRHLGERGGDLAGAAALPKAAAASAGRPRPGSRAARRHRPWPGSPRPPHRPGPGRPAGSQVTAAPTAYSHPGGPGIPWREAGARHDLTPATSAGTGALPGCPGQALRLSPHQISARPGVKQAARERAESALRKPESNGIKVCTQVSPAEVNGPDQLRSRIHSRRYGAGIGRPASPSMASVLVCLAWARGRVSVPAEN
jgi:hypothetical protein